MIAEPIKMSEMGQRTKSLRDSPLNRVASQTRD
jgi:hypothetical protein